MTFDRPNLDALTDWLLEEMDLDRGVLEAAMRALLRLSDEQWQDRDLQALLRGRFSDPDTVTQTLDEPDDLASLLELVDGFEQDQDHGAT